MAKMKGSALDWSDYRMLEGVFKWDPTKSFVKIRVTSDIAALVLESCHVRVTVSSAGGEQYYVDSSQDLFAMGVSLCHPPIVFMTEECAWVHPDFTHTSDIS